MITSIHLEYPLSYHERKIMERLCDGRGLTPPFTLLEEPAGTELLYDLSGLTPLAAHRTNCVAETFFLLRCCVLAFRAATDRMLKPERFFTNPEHIYIDEQGVRLMYCGKFGDDNMGADAYGNSACADDCTDATCESVFLRTSSKTSDHGVYVLLRPTIAALRSSDALGVRDAMTQIEEKIRSRNAGFSEILTLIESEEREWTYILP